MTEIIIALSLIMWAFVGVTIYLARYLDKKQGRKFWGKFWAYFFITSF